MKRTLRLVGGLVVAMLWGLGGCDWEDASDYNTSQGAGSTVNFSGTYLPSSGDVLAGTNIASLVLMQIGNALQVYDANASYYTGTVGSPGTQYQPNANGVYAAGATLLQCQVSFSGVNEASGKSITFTGTVRAVAVTDMTSETKTTTIDEEEITIVTTRTYILTEANARYILEGYWYEENGTVTIDAYCRSASGTFTTTETTTVTP